MQKKRSKNSIKNIAIVMDGNGRWAQKRNHLRMWGHVRGMKTVSNIVVEACNMGIESLTLYAFSTENWSRPKLEIKTIFKLFSKFLKIEERRLLENNIQLKVIGDHSKIPRVIKNEIKYFEEKTKSSTGMILNVAFSYGGRSEIINACNKFIENNPGEILNIKALESHLMTDISDVDLVIRTGGDKRISNFLLWQIAYAELFFSDTLWPDFTTSEFIKIIDEVGERDRRFGKI